MSSDLVKRAIEVLETEGFIAKSEAIEAEVAALKHDIARHMEIANTAEALAAKMRKALVELSGFDYPTAEKIAIARAALDGDK